MSAQVYRQAGAGDNPAQEHPSTDAPLRPLVIDILTLFPEMFAGPFDHSMIARAREAGLVELHVHNLRDWAEDRHRTTDDYAYGGGGGMVMKPEPVFAAVESILGLDPVLPGGPPPPQPVVLMSPQGRPFDHAAASALASSDRLLLLCGHYEGFDERIRDHLVTDEISLGDFVLTGGELPAMVVADAVARLRPGVLGLETATASDSFATGLLEHPHYTRPADFRGWGVPDILRSGDHGAVDRWRREQSLARTLQRRPDLLAEIALDDADRSFLDGLGWRPPEADPPLA